MLHLCLKYAYFVLINACLVLRYEQTRRQKRVSAQSSAIQRQSAPKKFAGFNCSAFLLLRKFSAEKMNLPNRVFCRSAVRRLQILLLPLPPLLIQKFSAEFCGCRIAVDGDLWSLVTTISNVARLKLVKVLPKALGRYCRYK